MNFLDCWAWQSWLDLPVTVLYCNANHSH